MGKKKKKTPSKIIDDSPSKAIKVKEQDKKGKDWIPLNLVGPTNTTATAAKDGTLLTITEHDAQRIDLLNNDRVFVFSVTQNDDRNNNNNRNQSATNVDSDSCSIQQVALCFARIIPNSSNNISGGTPLSSPSKANRLGHGTCRVGPVRIFNHLCGIHEVVEKQENPVNSPVPCTPTSSSLLPSSTPQSFSFARGGGGDAMIAYTPSPSTKLHSTPSKKKKKTKSQQLVWIVPLSHSLGQSISHILCKHASELKLTAIKRLVPPNTRDVICTLFRAAHGSQTFYRNNLNHQIQQEQHADNDDDASSLSNENLLSIIFQGRELRLSVQVVLEKQQEGANVGEDLLELMDKLNINDDNGSQGDEDNLVVLDAIESACESDQVHRLLLYIMSKETKLTLHDSNGPCSSATPTIMGTKQPDSSLQFVAGVDDALKRSKSILYPALSKSELYTSRALKPPRGILLFGPSGVGKSLLARQICHDFQMILPNIKVQFVSCVTLQSLTAIVGEAERELTRIMTPSKKILSCPPSLLVLDDIHLICPKRSSTTTMATPGMARLASTLLALLDGVHSNSNNCIVIGTTHDTSLLDPALRRPGRLDVEIEVPIPNQERRQEILRFQLGQLNQDDYTGISMPPLCDKDYEQLSKAAKGFHGADCMIAIKRAVRTAITSRTRYGIENNEQPIELTMEVLLASIRETRPSTISAMTVEIPKVYWSSIGGMKEVKNQLKEAIEWPLVHSKLLQQVKIPLPCGILMYGPPGCSKTLMARALATEGKMNFLAVKGPELLSKWLGESERALANLFQRARLASPCIIFFDEVDAIASQRQGGGGGGDRLLSQLLTELDGIGSQRRRQQQNRVVVVCATNRPDLLDSALVRPGRIDRKIYVGVPDSASREKIFEIGLRDKACASDIDYQHLSKEGVSGGFSGAEIIAICREAALLAIEEDEIDESMGKGSPRIYMRHLLQVICDTERQISPKMLDLYQRYSRANKL